MLEGYVEGDRSADDLVARLRPRGRGPGRRAWSTSRSTSAARCRPGSGSRAKASARTAACPSPTATARSASAATVETETAPWPVSELPASTLPRTGGTSAGRRAGAAGSHRRAGGGVPVDRGGPVHPARVLVSTCASRPSGAPDAQSMRARWHAELLGDRLPVRAGVDPDGLPALAGHRRALRRAGRARPAAEGPGSTWPAADRECVARPAALPRLSGLDRRLPRLTTYTRHLRVVAPVADGPLEVGPCACAPRRRGGLAGRGAARPAVDDPPPRRGRSPRASCSTSSRRPWPPGRTPAWWSCPTGCRVD